MNRNLCKTVIAGGGKLIPLFIPSEESKGLGLMNPSVLVERTKILLNLRNINYTLYHCEGQQLITGRWGPLSYLHPENDMHLRTHNFMCELDPTSLEIKSHYLTDTSTFDTYEPLWDFVGLEDARLVRWDGKLYQCGVRRDTTTNGVGRMELCEIEEIENPENGASKYREISRVRIEPPNDPNSYCEKNWVPVNDMPYHFIKWTNPTEVVKVNKNTGKSQTVFLSPSHIPNVPDFRGGTQVINYKGFRVTLAHEVNLFKNKLDQKDATYTHRFIIWDKEWNIVKISDSFSFMDGEIEFTCGMSLYGKDLLISFGFQDNAAYILRIPENMIDEIIGFIKHKFIWGPVTPDDRFYTQESINVEEGDVVIDMIAGIGDFAYTAIQKKPKHLFCVESRKDLFPTLQKNTVNCEAAICINKPITLSQLFDTYNIKTIDYLITSLPSTEDAIIIKKYVKKLVIPCLTSDIDHLMKILDVISTDIDVHAISDIKCLFTWDKSVSKNIKPAPKLILSKIAEVSTTKTNK